MNYVALRRLFPVLSRSSYLNSACTGPLPLTAREAMTSFLARCSSEGEVPYAECLAAVEETRAMCARLLGVGAESVALTANTSDGISVVLSSLSWRAGDNVVLWGSNFVANVAPWEYSLPEVEKRLVASAEPEAFADACDGRTRLVSVDWVSYASGVRLDVGAVADAVHAEGVPLLVDGIQGMGVLPIDLGALGVDWFVSGSSKWLLGPQGIGVLYASPEVLARARPTHMGWLSAPYEEFSRIFPLRAPDGRVARYEMGTRNAVGTFGFRESLRLLLSVGVPAVEARVRSLVGRLFDGLDAVGARTLTPRDACAGIVSFVPRGGAETAAERLAAGGVVCSLRDGAVRLSPHVFNSAEDVDRACALLVEEGSRCS